METEGGIPSFRVIIIIIIRIYCIYNIYIYDIYTSLSFSCSRLFDYLSSNGFVFDEKSFNNLICIYGIYIIIPKSNGEKQKMSFRNETENEYELNATIEGLSSQINELRNELKQLKRKIYLLNLEVRGI